MSNSEQPQEADQTLYQRDKTAKEPKVSVDTETKSKPKSKPKPKNKKNPENKKKKTNQNKIKRTLIVNCFKMTKS